MKNRILSILAAALAAAPALAGNDCASPTPVAGTIIVPFDLSNATFDGPGIVPCVGGNAGFTMDWWYCWTSDVTGTVTIDTCGSTDLDTAIAIYPANLACACPGDLPPACCNDDAGGNCGKQSKVTCDVVCGRTYLVQLAARPNGALPTGEIRFGSSGEPCGNGKPLTPPDCTDCCGTRPPLVDSQPSPFPPGQVAAVTFGVQDAIAGNIGVLRLVGLGDQTAAPLVGSGSLWGAPTYAHPQWDLQTLGSIFGVTFDGQGNIFAAHSVGYWFDSLGTLGVSAAGDGRGAIYRMDGVTGAPQLFRTLPQAAGAGAELGIGNLDFDCSRGRLLATNLEDGRIYSIRMADGAISAFDHETGAVEAESATGNGAQIAEGPNPGGTSSEPAGFPGYGNAPYAVKVAGDRVYYSVWQAYGSAQTVHSVQIDAIGDFIAGTSRLEFSIPFAPGHPYPNVNCPIADISFDDQCCMLLAERSMQGLSNVTAHNSRAWRACFDAATASWTPVRYDIGSQGQPSDWQNSAGGIDFVSDATNGAQAWMTGDFYAQPLVGSYYGISGIPLVEANPGQLDTLLGPGVNMTGQKTQQGSLDITCPVAASPCEFITKDIDCVPAADGSISFLWTLDLVNNSPVPANLLILSDPAFSPNNVIVLNPPLAPGGTMTLNIPISGGSPGDTFCFAATLASSGKQECCSTEVCIVLPDCGCFDTDAEVRDLPGAGSFELTLSGFTNFTSITNPPGFVGEWVSIAVAPGYAATVSPTLVNIPALPLFASTNVGPLTISTALPAGSPIILIIGLHSQTFHPCCFVEVTIEVPAQAGSSTPGDANGDGTVNGADMALLLSNWGLAGSTDFNGDGTTDAADLAILLTNWG